MVDLEPSEPEVVDVIGSTAPARMDDLDSDNVRDSDDEFHRREQSDLENEVDGNLEGNGIENGLEIEQLEESVF